MNVIIDKSQPVRVQLQGRLDTAAAAEVTPDFAQLNELAAYSIVIDCEQLDYISSSGLRLLLSLRKEVAAKGGHLKIQHIHDDILQVFKMTGFVNLFDMEP